MDLKREPASSSSSSTTSFTPSPEELSATEEVVNPTEMEAAEALADLAQSAMRGRVVAESAWGSKGKRVWKRVKSESPSFDSVLNGVDSEASRPDLAEEWARKEKHRFQEVHGNPILKAVKTEQDVDFVKPTSLCAPRGRPSGGGKSRLCLTEEEKEARRIRRVLANRESARQTIRRRQALCEELTRKAADLTRENEDLKREREFALRRYQSLEITNKQLKEQVVKAVKQTAAGEAQGELKSSNVKIPASLSTSIPFSFNHHPFNQIFWPSIIQTSHRLQPFYGPDNAFSVQTSIHPPAPGLPAQSGELENFVNENYDARAPMCIMPCPWLFAPPDQGNVVQPHPFFASKGIRDGFPLNKHFTADSSSTATDGGILSSCLPSDDKGKASGSNESRPIGGFSDSLDGFPRNVDGIHVGLHLKEPPSSASPTIVLNHENTVTDEATLAKPSQSLGDMPGKSHEEYDHSHNRLANAVAAAEARKRRKELTKLKSIHGRQCRINV